jgi:hypothetical protein
MNITGHEFFDRQGFVLPSGWASSTAAQGPTGVAMHRNNPIIRIAAARAMEILLKCNYDPDAEGVPIKSMSNSPPTQRFSYSAAGRLAPTSINMISRLSNRSCFGARIWWASLPARVRKAGAGGSSGIGEASP